MDLIQTGLRSSFLHSLLNIFLPPLATACLHFTLPPYLLVKSLLALFRSAFPEDVSGKVVLITGASSGIGEHLAYSYAKRGSCLALVARRENQLREVADMAYHLGSPEVISILADVSKVEDCQSFVDDVIRHFGRLDHLVANAGVAPVFLFEDCKDVTTLTAAMDTNFWGSAYSSYFGIPHLRRSRGKLVAIASSAAWLPIPRMSVYNATKAAVVSFYETLRVEIGSDVTVTIVTPGLVESEMTQGKFLSGDGQMVLDPELRDVQFSVMPIRSVEVAAEEIVKGVCRGDNYITEPAWMKWSFYWKVFCPEVLEWINRMLLVAGADERTRRARSRDILELSGLKDYLYPESVRNP